ncbi:MAG: hypothetical protein KF764_31900 [Labilithrix sp.]|nr:hypothetical protein [Labilithrix sp.]MBX3224685.1 hypothetical protein [Labilithrix sp.]
MAAKKKTNTKKKTKLPKFVKYDDASWHYGGTYPDDLPPEAAATHIGMFVAWCLAKGMGSDEHVEDLGALLKKLVKRSVTPGDFLMKSGEKFCSDDLNDEGNAFTLAYYQGKNHDSRYVDDFLAAFKVDEKTIYGVPDSWKNFDVLCPKMDRRYAAWVKAGRPKYLK